MKLYLIRHAKSLRNAHIASSVDAILTDDGKEQARRLAIALRNIKPNIIYCSTLTRAKETLSIIYPIFKKSKIKTVYTEEIREHRMGVFGSKGLDDWGSYASFARRKGIEFQHFKPKGGESLDDTYNRAGRFYRQLLIDHENDEVIVIGHGLFLLYVIFNAIGVPVTEGKYYGLSNASISTLEIDKKGQVIKYNISDIRHLAQGGSPVNVI